MDVVVRLLLRFLLVPLGYLAAVIAATLVIVFGAWRLGTIDTSAYPEAAIVGMVAGPILAAVLLATMWLPASIGILISEAFAIRSWIFHAANGAASAWFGWHLFGSIDGSPVPLHEPLHVIAAGLAGGFAYWAVAGFSAGFWLPVFRRRSSPAHDVTLATRQ
ncbi:MAG: hypothetical protein ACRECO_11385 [Xanthobacteraceae bacterium]